MIFKLMLVVVYAKQTLQECKVYDPYFAAKERESQEARGHVS
jgi:hypothetical protein